MITIKDIEGRLLKGNVPPAELAEMRVILSAKFSFATNKLEEILLKKPSIWNELRENYKSDTACERAWEATEFGEKERHWKFQIRKIEKMMSAAKTMIDVETSELRHI